ncbi:MAG TPA: hypothetical protein VGM50_16335 [Gemmatimonadaceae bacterium]
MRRLRRFRSLARRHRSFALLVALLSCRSLVDPPLPPNTLALTPPSVYSTWWNIVQSCSGISGRMADIKWYQVQNTTFINADGKVATGYWSSVSNQIVLASGSVLDGGTVRHEMLHALVRSPGHPRSAFLDKCAGIVDCSADCASDAGPLPHFNGPSILADSIQVSFRLDPASPAASVNDATFMVTITATNPTGDSVSVILDPINPTRRPYTALVSGTFGARTFQVLLDDSSLVRFAPHQTKQHIFDFVIGGDTAMRTFLPGSYNVSLAYGRNGVMSRVQLKP